jgi:hypothetical protein
MAGQVNRCSVLFWSILVASLAIIGLVAGIVTTSIRTVNISRSTVFAIVAGIAAFVSACGFFTIWYFYSSNRRRPRGQKPYPYALFFDVLLGSSFFLAHTTFYLFSMIFYSDGRPFSFFLALTSRSPLPNHFRKKIVDSRSSLSLSLSLSLFPSHFPPPKCQTNLGAIGVVVMQIMFAATIAGIAYYSLAHALPFLQEFPPTSSFRQGLHRLVFVCTFARASRVCGDRNAHESRKERQ